MAAYTTMPGDLVDSWHRCSRSHRDSDASTSWGHISAPSRPFVLVLGFLSFRCSLTFRSRYWLLSSSSMVGYIGDTAQFHQNFFFVKRYMQSDLKVYSNKWYCSYIRLLPQNRQVLIGQNPQYFPIWALQICRIFKFWPQDLQIWRVQKVAKIGCY